MRIHLMAATLLTSLALASFADEPPARAVPSRCEDIASPTQDSGPRKRERAFEHVAWRQYSKLVAQLP